MTKKTFEPNIMNRDENINRYFREVRDYDLLSKEEEQELALRVQKGDGRAFDKMVKANLRLVVTVAHKYTNDVALLKDYIQEGNIGLMHAVHKFDPKEGKMFATFAWPYIAGSILKFMAQSGNLVYMPLNRQKLINKILRVIDRYEQNDGYMPAVYDIAEELQISVGEVMSLMGYSNSTVSLSMPLGSDEDCGVLSDVIPDTGVDDADESCIRNSEWGLVRDALSHLSDVEREVTCMRFGIGCYEEPSALICVKTGLSHEGARKVEKRSLKKLRAYLECA